MPGSPFDWNVIVAGAWNLAILTPEGVVRRLFRLDPTTAVEVQVSLDRRAPIRIVHSNLTVVPASNRLIVAPTESGAAGLREASMLAARAIDALPETPFSAAGINIRYRFDPLPDLLVSYFGSTADDRLADASFRILGRMFKRTLQWNAGVINLEANVDDTGSGTVLLNFHRDSTNGSELRDWLAGVDAVIDSASSLLTSTLDLRVGEEP